MSHQSQEERSRKKFSTRYPSSSSSTDSSLNNNKARPVTAVILKRKDIVKEKDHGFYAEDEFSTHQIQPPQTIRRSAGKDGVKAKSAKVRNSSSPSRQSRTKTNSSLASSTLDSEDTMIFKKKKQFLVDEDEKSDPIFNEIEVESEEKDLSQTQEPNLVPESKLDAKANGDVLTSQTKRDPTKYFYRSNDVTVAGYPLNEDLLDFSDDGGRSQCDDMEDRDESDTLSETDAEEDSEGNKKETIFDRVIVTRKNEDNLEGRQSEIDSDSRRQSSSPIFESRVDKPNFAPKFAWSPLGDSVIQPQRPKTSDGSERVKVIVRCRPLSRKEIAEGHDIVVKVVHESNEIEVRRPTTASSSASNSNSDQKVFAFDAVYDYSTSQTALYDDAFRPLVDSVLQGFNGTIFAYGQTGTGKTYTMEGIHVEEEHHGVIPNAFKHIFKQVAENPNKQYLIRASYLEIYQEDIRDLLSKDRKQHREIKESTSGVYVKDLSTFLCSNFNEINELMAKGNKSRAVGATDMNERSSRSHAIFQITVEVSEEWPDGRNHIRVGKLNLVDLAGSERQTKTGATGERLKEATKINLSLSALGNVIGALVDGKSSHIPYRDSKLTRLLQDSLGGNSRTIMVATIGPASFNWDETMTTLRYASRAKKIKNKPKVNEDPKDAMLRQYQEEIVRLRAELIRKKEEQQSMLQEQVEEAEQVKSDTTKRQFSDSTDGSLGQQLKMVEEQRLKDLAPLLEPYGLDPANDPKDIMSQLEQRRQALLKDNLTVTTERDKLIKKLEETQSLVKSTEDDCTKLTERIQWLESKVLTGGKSLLDHTNEQQKLIEEKQKELEEQNKRYEEVRKKLEENQLTTVELRNTLDELDREYQLKTKKLKKITQKLLSTREELGALDEEYSQNRKEMQNVLVELKKEMTLKRLLVENFIPSGSRKMIENRIQWNETEETYRVNPYDSTVMERPKINRMLTSPLYNLSTMGPIENIDNVYYTDENILQLGLELPSPLVKDYVPPVTDPYYTSLVKRAVEDAEKEVIIDCRRLRKKRTKTAALPITEDLFQFGENLVRRVKSARLPPRNTIQYQDFTVV